MRKSRLLACLVFTLGCLCALLIILRPLKSFLHIPITNKMWIGVAIVGGVNFLLGTLLLVQKEKFALDAADKKIIVGGMIFSLIPSITILIIFSILLKLH